MHAVSIVGGIMVAWSSKTMKVEESVKGKFSVSMLCRNKKNRFRWIFFGIYSMGLLIIRQ